MKQQSFVNTATFTSMGSLGTAGKLCLDFVYMRHTCSAVGLILRQNSGDYSGAGQNTAALSEIAEVFFSHCGAFSKDSQDERSKSAILYK